VGVGYILEFRLLLRGFARFCWSRTLFQSILLYDMCGTSARKMPTADATHNISLWHIRFPAAQSAANPINNPSTTVLLSSDAGHLTISFVLLFLLLLFFEKLPVRHLLERNY